jgi:16S rRNA (cytidine1402-2'-O)-methyltransferase
VAGNSPDSIARAPAGTLFLVATPIGNLGDLTQRARELLAGADLLLAEDTRHTTQLLHACGIRRAVPAQSLHEHNERERVPAVIARLRAGESVALVSDAGTPLVSDPGAALVAAAVEAGIPVTAVPGPCAVIAALSLSALPAERFAFEGFLPSRAVARAQVLDSLAHEAHTLVFYEAPHRLVETLAALEKAFGAQRRAAVAREMTKRFETVYRGSLGELSQRAAGDPDMQRGEIVIVVQGAAEASTAEDREADRVLRALIAELPASQASRLAAEITGRKRKELYMRALALTGASES